MNPESIGAYFDTVITLFLGIAFIFLRKNVFKGDTSPKATKLRKLFVIAAIFMIAYAIIKIAMKASGHPF